MFGRYIRTNTNHPGFLETFPTSALLGSTSRKPLSQIKPTTDASETLGGREGEEKMYSSALEKKKSGVIFVNSLLGSPD